MNSGPDVTVDTLESVLEAFHQHDRSLFATRFGGIPDVHYGGDRHFVCGEREVSE